MMIHDIWGSCYSFAHFLLCCLDFLNIVLPLSSLILSSDICTRAHPMCVVFCYWIIHIYNNHLCLFYNTLYCWFSIVFICFKKTVIVEAFFFFLIMASLNSLSVKSTFKYQYWHQLNVFSHLRCCLVLDRTGDCNLNILSIRRVCDPD